MLGFGRKRQGGGAFVMRVSDVVDVPLRGLVLRLRTVEGVPSLGDVAPGSRLQLRSPGGEEGQVRIVEHTVTGGKQTQERLERTRELDVIVVADGASAAGIRPEIGWTASGPVRDESRK